jgi:hypothetical protein
VDDQIAVDNLKSSQDACDKELYKIKCK